MSRKRNWRDMFRLAAAQGAAALGTLLGVKLLTHLLPPETFGVVSLGLSSVALLIAALSTPFTQAVMHLYPAYAQQGRLQQLREGLRLAARRMKWWVAASAFAAIVTCWIFSHEHVSLVLLLMLLLASDVRRSLHTSVLNAAQRHGRYALWVACDAWSRPLAAAAAVLVAGQSATIIIAAHLFASLVLTTLFAERSWSGSRTGEPTSEFTRDNASQLGARMWQYALPLIPVGVIGWSNNLSDRFIIGGMLGVDAAGVYAATFGLASAPFIMLTTVLEQAFRPEYQNAVTAGDYGRADRQLLRWIIVTLLVASVGVLAFLFWREHVAALLLGPQYRAAMDLMPWIAAGYAVRAVAYVFDRVAYAFGRTRRALSSQLCAACATMIVTPCAIAVAGLDGAAIAVPICFGIYLCAAFVNATKTRRESTTVFDERSAVPSP
jgi:O-antigen/teichoic acid export membrane protein